MSPRFSSKSPAGRIAGAFRVYRLHLLASLLIFLTSGYFCNTRPGWNVNSQFALACAIAEQGTFRIDRYHDILLPTEDKSIYRGHYYSDKSPLTAFLAVPVMYVYGLMNPPQNNADYYSRALYWVTWITIGLLSAVICFMIIELLKRRGCAPIPAVLGGIFWITATPLLGYSILFFNYIPACALVLAGFWLVDPALSRINGHFSPSRMLAAGMLLGLAAWSLNTMALAALVMTLYLACLCMVNRHYTRNGLLSWVMGGILGACGYFIYSFIIFDTPGSPYRFEADPFFREQMSRGFMGATVPSLWVAWLVTFHPFKGFFLWWPVLTMALGGCIYLVFRGDLRERIEASCSLLFLAGLLLYNSAYYMWWGGYSYAPRHLLPAVALLFTGLPPILRNHCFVIRMSIILLIGVSILFNMAAVSLDPQVPPFHEQEQLMQPESIRDWRTPYLILQKHAWGKGPGDPVRGQTDVNWGTLMGIKGIYSLLPLALAWTLLLMLIFHYARREKSKVPLSAGSG